MDRKQLSPLINIPRGFDHIRKVKKTYTMEQFWYDISTLGWCDLPDGVVNQTLAVRAVGMFDPTFINCYKVVHSELKQMLACGVVCAEEELDHLISHIIAMGELAVGNAVENIGLIQYYADSREYQSLHTIVAALMPH